MIYEYLKFNAARFQWNWDHIPEADIDWRGTILLVKLSKNLASSQNFSIAIVIPFLPFSHFIKKFRLSPPPLPLCRFPGKFIWRIFPEKKASSYYTTRKLSGDWYRFIIIWIQFCIFTFILFLGLIWRLRWIILFDLIGLILELEMTTSHGGGSLSRRSSLSLTSSTSNLKKKAAAHENGGGQPDSGTRKSMSLSRSMWVFILMHLVSRMFWSSSVVKKTWLLWFL